jgi:hypothetical protein
MATCPGFLGVTRWPFGTLPFWQGLGPADVPETPPPPPGAPGDGAATDGSPRVSIELFVSPESPTSAAALRNIERALVGLQPGDVRLEIFDVSVHPGRAAEALSEHLEVAGLPRAPRGD